MSTAGELPQQSEAQRIGALATKCFTSNIPDSWIPKPLDGDDDFGLDYQIQVMESGRATHMFRVQLKGSTSPDTSSGGDFFSVSLKASTVRYYMLRTEPILLVLADLSSGKKPKDCPLYHKWIHEELRRINAAELADDQKYVTFRVPTANALTDETDLRDELDRYRRVAKVGDALDVLADRQNPGMTASSRVGLLERIPDNLARTSPHLFAAIMEEQTSAWPVAPQGSIPWHLKEAAELLWKGNEGEAEEHLKDVESSLDKTTELERADYKFLVGRLHACRSEYESALEAYADAAKISGNQPKHLVAWAE